MTFIPYEHLDKIPTFSNSPEVQTACLDDIMLVLGCDDAAQRNAVCIDRMWNRMGRLGTLDLPAYVVAMCTAAQSPETYRVPQ